MGTIPDAEVARLLLEGRDIMAETQKEISALKAVIDSLKSECNALRAILEAILRDLYEAAEQKTVTINNTIRPDEWEKLKANYSNNTTGEHRQAES